MLTNKELEALKQFLPKEWPEPVCVRCNDQSTYNMLKHLFDKGLINSHRFTVVDDRFFFWGYVTEEGMKCL